MAERTEEHQKVNAEHSSSKQAPVIKVSEDDLPLSCPMPDQTLWNQHPRVFMAFDKEGRASCPYCGNCYQLVKS